MIYENNVFNPTRLDLSRSTFHMTPTSSGTANAGRLLPVRTFWVQPGDSMKMDVKALIKMSTPVYPTMDALFADVSFFFVPFKLLLSRRYGSPSVNDASESWEAIVGAQDFYLNMPVPANGVKMPVLNFTSSGTGYKPGNLMDYFPVYYGGANNLKVNALPLLAYFAIWNENYRDPNLMQPVTWNISTAGTGEKYLNPSGMVPLYATREELKYRNSLASDPDYMLCNALGSGKTWTPNSPDTTSRADEWLPFPVCRFHGFFGSCLPWPQRNTDGVLLPLGNSAPVVAGSSFHALGNGGFIWNTDVDQSGASRTVYGGRVVNDTTPQWASGGWNVGTGEADTSVNIFTKTNLIADLRQATAANINALRASIQLQRWYEKLARSGNRYDEFEYGTFGVRPHDSGDNKPLYLGGKRINLAIEMVASTNGDTTASPGEGAGSLGSLGAFSHTNDADGYFYHSFDDWGVVMCVVCIRHHDTFASGSDPFWLKSSRDDIYFPTFAHLGEQVEGDHLLIDKADTGVAFGYQPAWTEYRNEIDRVHGLLRPGQSLDFMTYARSFGSGTTLLEFLNASSQVATVDQTLAVSSNAAGFQFVYQFTFDISWRRCMPTDSIPGLMDHF